MRSGAVAHLIVPGLLGKHQGIADSAEAPPESPSLCKLLSIANSRAGGDNSEQAVAELFALQRQPHIAPPFAALALLGEGKQPERHWWLRADPVHLVPDLQRLRLAEPSHLNISRDDAQALTREVSALFEESGVTLHCAHPARWYLALDEDPAIATKHWSEAVSGSAESLLPTGPGSAHWRRLMTEAQMLLHASQANVSRESRGLAPVNALWIWGAGRLPEPNRTLPPTAVCTSDPLLLGLARLHGSREMTAPCDFTPTETHGATVVVRDDRCAGPARCGDAQTWQIELAKLEAQLFRPALQALRSGALSALTIDALSGKVYQVARRDLRRFWRRARGLRDYS